MSHFSMNKPTLARQTNKNANSINTPRRQIVAPNCAVCRAAGKSVEVCGSHWPKDRDGNTTCPTLLSQICGYCKCSGHTPKYCPVLEKQKRDDAATSSFKSTNKAYTQTQPNANPVQKQTPTVAHNKGQFAAFACSDSESDSESEDEEFDRKWDTSAKKPKLPIAPTLPDQFPALNMQTPKTIETRPTTPTTLPPPIVSYASKAAATAFTRPHTHNNSNTNLTIIPNVVMSQKDRKLQHQIATNASTQPCGEDANDEQEWREKQQNALHMQRYRLTKIDSDRDASDMFVPENDNTW